MSEPLTREHIEALGYVNNSYLRYVLEYEIVPGLRVAFKACVGGWSEPELWIGSGIITPIPLKSVSQFHSLLNGIGK